MLHDYVHERWSAGRAVTPELWQLMPGFIDDAIVEDLKHAAQSLDGYEKNAAAKALGESGLSNITVATTWEDIGRNYCNSKN